LIRERGGGVGALDAEGDGGNERSFVQFYYRSMDTSRDVDRIGVLKCFCEVKVYQLIILK